MICPECIHDMYDDGWCLECGFEGIGYCGDAWLRMLRMYDLDER